MSLSFAVNYYHATGEGHHVFLLVTSENLQFDSNWRSYYSEQKLKDRFKAIFGNYFGENPEILSKEAFLKEYDVYVPDVVKKYINKSDSDDFPYYEWYSTLYINYA